MLKTDFNTIFITNETSTQSVIPSGYILLTIPASVKIEDEHYWLKTNCEKGSLIIADGYLFIASYQAKIKKAGFNLIYIDDLAVEHFYADAVINHAPKLKAQKLKREPYMSFYNGLKYAMLRPQFLEAATQQRKIKATVEEVFVCFGGADMYDLSFKTTQALLTFEHVKHIHIVLGGAYKHEAILALKEANSERISIHRNITADQMLRVMNTCDFAIAPASTIIYELCCVIMPILGGYYVENQRQIYEGLLSSNVIYEGGDFSNDTAETFRNKISKYFKNSGQEQCVNQQKLFDGTVKKRFIKLALAYSNVYSIREASADDLQLFFDWANDPLTRKMSFSSNAIKLEDHTRWFNNQLQNENSHLLILDVKTETGSAPVGNVKFDSNGVIGISLDAAYRGKGLGALLINKGLAHIAATKQYPTIFAFIKEDNTNSRTIFEQAGFEYTKMSEIRGVACLEYQYQLTN